jgi:zinc transport system ATP-binding protein
MSAAAVAPALLDVRNVSVRREREMLLSDVSLSVARGSLHAIVGPNGAGKSTFIATVLGLTPFEGRIAAHWEREGRIGYVPQAFAVDRTLPVTVEDFLALTRQRRPVCFGVNATTRRSIASLLDRVGLCGLERRPLSVLSGGELRRVLFAHALDPSPELLILDEPASGMDEAAARTFESVLVATRAAGATILMVSHDLDQVRRLADRVTVLDRRVVREGSVDETLNDDSLQALLSRQAGAAR